jgi:tetratricopeptide (TPR) repeat protein
MLDDLARKAAAQLRDSKTGRQAVLKLRKYLFLEKDFTAAAETASNHGYSLDKTLESGTDNCFGLSILYLALAERLRMPMYLVCISSTSIGEQGHALVRYAGDSEQFLIETTMKGGIFPAYQVRKRFGNSLKYWPGSLDMDLGGRKVLALYAVLLGAAERRNPANRDSAEDLVRKSLLLWPDSPLLLTLAARTLSRISADLLEESIEMLKKARKMSPATFDISWAMFWLYAGAGKWELAVEAATEFVDSCPKSRGADVLRLSVYGVAAQEWLAGKYKFKSLKEVEEAMAFVERYKADYPDAALSEEALLLERLPGLLEKCRQSLLENESRKP